MPDFNVLPVPKARLLGALDRLGPLLATQAQVATAAAAIDLAQAEKRPDWSVTASYGPRRDGRDDLIMLVVGIERALFYATTQDTPLRATPPETRRTVDPAPDAP